MPRIHFLVMGKQPVDTLGQQIQIGDKVLWAGGRAQGGGFTEGLAEVIGFTRKLVEIRNKRRSVRTYPDTLVVVTKLVVHADGFPKL